MHFRKLISLWALLALMLGQVALAQHSASHVDHEFSQEITAFYDAYDDHHHDNDPESQQHNCPECLLTKSLQTAFYNAPVTLFVSSKAEIFSLRQNSSIVVGSYYNPNAPRAPPAVLI